MKGIPFQPDPARDEHYLSRTRSIRNFRPKKVLYHRPLDLTVFKLTSAVWLSEDKTGQQQQ